MYTGQAVVACVLLVGTIATLLYRGTVPAELWALDSSVVTFYFVALATRNKE